MASVRDGTAGNDYMDGAGGDFLLRGGLGDDIYIVEAGDIVEEAPGEGFDAVYTRTSYTLAAGAHVETFATADYRLTMYLLLNGNELNNPITGNNGDNSLNGHGGSDYLIGLDGNDRLDGGAGRDHMVGGLGDDIYIVDDPLDAVIERAGEGFDYVYSSTTFLLQPGVEVEVLATVNYLLTDPLSLTGNEFNNIITGNEGNNWLGGGGGDDTLSGLGGHDILDGGTGADLMIGGLGNDIYLVDNAGDTVRENVGEGHDSVYTSVSWTLTAGAEIELLGTRDYLGTDAIALTGNEFSNSLVGNHGDNRLDGGGGADYLTGLLGDDVYVVDHAGDRVYEREGEGYDTVLTKISYALSAGSHVEVLATFDPLGTAPLDLTGNAYANVLRGNAGANLLIGGGGADSLYGGGGDDIYHVDSADDHVGEAAGEGMDTVLASVSYALAAGSHVEVLRAAVPASTAAIDLTGNEFANIIHGNAGANILDGGAGNDVLTGGAGADIFAFTSAFGADNVDMITDFTPGTDRILLGGFAGQPFAALATGSLAPGAFIIGAEASDADDRIIYNSATGALLYDPDGAGGAAAVQFATIAPGLSLNVDSFTVSGPVNRPPTISSGTTASVQENSPASTIVYQVVAIDLDGDTIAYRLEGADAARLTIDAAGAVRLKAPADYETQSSYSFMVYAVDSGGTGDSRLVTLNIIDVVETLPRYSIAEAEPNGAITSAQPLDRSKFSPSNDTNVPDPSLPAATITGTIEALGDRDFFSVTLKAGELLILDVDGTTTLDSELRLFDPNGVQIAINDDAGSFDPGSTAHSGVSHNMDSLIRIRVPIDGTYTFSIQSYVEQSGATSSGGYTLHVVVGPQATRAQIDEENIQALLSGSSWSMFDLTYGFPTSAAQYGNEGRTETAAGMQPLNFTQQAAVHTILLQIAAVTNLTFSELISNPGGAQMRYALSADPETAHAYYPGPGNGGDSWYNTNLYNSPAVGNYQWLTFVHETGHALGLKHSHEMPPISLDRDSLEYTVMTYRSFIGDSVDDDGGYRNETWGYPQTLMMYDIAALQRMYGANFAANAGDTVYSWSPLSGAFMINGVTQWIPGGNRVFMTLWDGGGIDTIDLSQYTTNTRIDLRPGEWIVMSDIQLAHLGAGNYARGNVANALLYNGDPRSLIENAIGGSANDVITANQAVNRLAGGPAADTFVWWSTGDSPLGAADTILDFNRIAQDRIDLSRIDADPTTPADDAFAFVGTNAFSGGRGELRYEIVDGNAHVFADVNGDTVPDFHIILLNVPILHAGDFIL